VQRSSLPIRSHASTDVTANRPGRLAKVRLLTLLAGGGLLLTAGCGSVAQDPVDPAAKPVELKVQPARFSSPRQLSGDQVTLSVTITNTGTSKVDDLVVTLEGNEPTKLAVRDLDSNPNDVPQGTSDLPNTIARDAWFIDDGPQHAPLGGGNSWNAGSLEPGKTKTVRWSMAAVTPGRHTLNYFVSGGLTDNAAKATTGTGIKGSVTATIANSNSEDASS
jgi:hypothetical protein